MPPTSRISRKQPANSCLLIALKPPKGFNEPAPPTAVPGIRPGLYSRLRGIAKSKGDCWVPDAGYKAYKERFAGKRRSWLLEERKSLAYNVQHGLVSESFVKALLEAAAEAETRPASPVRLVHTPEEAPQEEMVVMNVDYGGKGGKKRILVPKSLCPDRVGGDEVEH